MLKQSGEYMDHFEFEDDSIAEIKKTEGKVSVVVTHQNGDVIQISGFPNTQDAHNFIMFGDFDNPKDNDFINIANPNYDLKWEFS